MNNSLPSLDISPPQVVIVAQGDTASHQANERGHLFEKFMARLFEAYGCETPTTQSLNVRQNGYELDISTRFKLSREGAIAECKAYSASLPIATLNAFYGKLNTERLDNGTVHGWFVAIPGITPDALQLARKLENKDSRFRYISANQIYELVRDRKWIEEIESTSEIITSDRAILITSTGVSALAKQLDPVSRMPVRVLAKSTAGAINTSDLALLAQTDYVAGLPVQDWTHPDNNKSSLTSTGEIPTLAKVVGSREDFEYQFPAAPEFFVGRRDILSRVKTIVSRRVERGEVIVLNAQSGWGKSSLALRIAKEVEREGGTAVVFDTRTASSPIYVTAALREVIVAAATSGKLMLPTDASFASLQSTLRTLQSSIWPSNSLLLLFFDQFENVFRDARLTREFRDLALAVRNIEVPFDLLPKNSTAMM